MDIKKLIARINELAHKQRGAGLTPEEKEEQAVLRRQYLDNIRAQLIPQLEAIKVVDENSPEYIKYLEKKAKSCGCGCGCEGHDHSHH